MGSGSGISTNRANCFVTDSFWEALGMEVPPRGPHLANWFDHVFAEDRDSAMDNVAAHLADPTMPFDQTLRMRAADGHTVLVRARGVAIRRHGAPDRMLGTHTVINDLRRDDLSNKLSEVLALSNDAIVVWSPGCGVKRWNRGAERLYGLLRPAILRHHHFDHLAPVFPRPWPEIEHQVAAGEPWRGEVEWTRPDGRKVITDTQIERITVDHRGTLLLQVDHDITDKMELAERQRTMSRELNHRVKNLFAVIRALTKLTARGQRDIATLVDNLDRRISALAAAHIVSLGHETVDGAPLDEILHAVLSAYPPTPAALSLDGPTLRLSQERVTPMGLILNELATNALKHGAWSTTGGHIAVRWRVREAEGGFLLAIRWTETAPGFAAPDTSASGFGTQLIDLSVRQLGATMRHSWGAEGLDLMLTLEVTPGQIGGR
ncbi:MAG: hypothetical protein AcusKO_10000 [Acuticoccus sp.]